MFRSIIAVAVRSSIARSFVSGRTFQKLSSLQCPKNPLQHRQFCFLSVPQLPNQTSLLKNSAVLNIYNSIPQQRTVTKFSLKKGKRKTVKAAIKRFYRLNWGGWIRTKSGRHKHLWKKSAARKRRLRQHVFVNGTQSWLLDKMVTKYWRKPRFYVDDPYEPYHSREEFHTTRRRPIDHA